MFTVMPSCIIQSVTDRLSCLQALYSTGLFFSYRRWFTDKTTCGQ